MTKRTDLSILDEAFADATVPSPATVPDGAYSVVIESVELRSTRRSHRPMLCWVLRILDEPPFASRRLWRNQVLSPENMGWLKKDLRLCGLTLAKLSDLPAHLEALSGIRLRVTKRTVADYVSVLFRYRIDS